MGLWDMVVETWEGVCDEVDNPQLTKGSVIRVCNPPLKSECFK